MSSAKKGSSSSVSSSSSSSSSSSFSSSSSSPGNVIDNYVRPENVYVAKICQKTITSSREFSTNIQSILLRSDPKVQAVVAHVSIWQEISKKVKQDSKLSDTWFLIKEEHAYWPLNTKIEDQYQGELKRALDHMLPNILLLNTTASAICPEGESKQQEQETELMERGNRIPKFKYFINMEADVKGLLCYMVRGKVCDILLEMLSNFTVDEKAQTMQAFTGIPLHDKFVIWAATPLYPYPNFFTTNYNGFYTSWGLVGLERQKIPKCDSGLRGMIQTPTQRWWNNYKIMKEKQYWLECLALLEWTSKSTHDIRAHEAEFEIWDETSVIAWYAGKYQLGIQAFHELLRRNRFDSAGRKRLMEHKDRLLSNVEFYNGKDDSSPSVKTLLTNIIQCIEKGPI
jgi:hypothetical protein